MRTLFLYAALSSCSLASSVLADTISLTNGDRISGTIVLLDGGRLLVKTEYAGTISLDIRQVAGLDSQQQFLVKRQRNEPGQLVRLQAGGAGNIRLTDATGSRTQALAGLHQLIPHQPQKLASDLLWSGSLHLAADFKRKENASDKYDLKLDSRLRHGRWRHGLDAQYEHETRDDSKKTDRFTGGYGLDYFMTRRWFWKNKGKYTYDRVEDVRRQTTLGSGPGFQFWDNALGTFSVSTLLTHNHYSFANDERVHFNSLATSWDYQRYYLAKTLELYYLGEIGLPFTPDIDFILDNEAGLRYKINSWASFSLRTEWEKIKSRQGTLNDRRYLMGIGVRW